MSPITRREFLQLAAVIGATAVWGEPVAALPGGPWRERRDLFPEGVASGDPDSSSVLLWTRRPPSGGAPMPTLRVEVAEDEGFRRVVATSDAAISADADWTCRVLVGGLKPAHVYWYRFTDSDGIGEPDRADDDRAGERRCAAGQVRVRVVPEREPWRAERIPADDL